MICRLATNKPTGITTFNKKGHCAPLPRCTKSPPANKFQTINPTTAERADSFLGKSLPCGAVPCGPDAPPRRLGLLASENSREPGFSFTRHTAASISCSLPRTLSDLMISGFSAALLAARQHRPFATTLLLFDMAAYGTAQQRPAGFLSLSRRNAGTRPRSGFAE